MLRIILITSRTTPRELAAELLAKVDPDDLADLRDELDRRLRRP
jgi:hypothetical protein